MLFAFTYDDASAPMVVVASGRRSTIRKTTAATAATASAVTSDTQSTGESSAAMCAVAIVWNSRHGMRTKNARRLITNCACGPSSPVRPTRYPAAMIAPMIANPVNTPPIAPILAPARHVTSYRTEMPAPCVPLHAP